MDQAPPASKRPRNEVDDDEPAQLDPKRRNEETTDEHDRKSSYLVVHSISCDGDEDSYHSHHEENTYYLDVPRLFARDNKANGLRGTDKVQDLGQFLEEHPGYDFVVIKHYSCEAYYKEHEREFQEIGDSKLRTKIPSEQRALLYTLPSDLPLATAKDESITHFSREMAEALNALDALCQWDGEFDYSFLEDLRLEAPYTIVYHSRTSLNDYQQRGIDPIHWPHIEGFRDYVLGSMSNDYAEADAYLKKNELIPRHLTKLFRRGDVLVTQRGGDQVGLLCRSVSYPSPRVCDLQCESWIFDGVFRRKMESLRVVWPSGSSQDAISIVALETFPLRFGGDELIQRLKQRGQMLWDCRFRKYVTYEESSSTLDMQTVSLRLNVTSSQY